MQFPVRLVARRTPGCMMWLSPVLALGLTVLFGAILFAMLGKDPLNALYVFLIAPLETLRGWAEVGVKMTPLLLAPPVSWSAFEQASGISVPKASSLRAPSPAAGQLWLAPTASAIGIW